MKRKALLFFVIFVFTFFITSNVFATVITCDYGEYILELDTLYYDKDIESVGNDGYCKEEPMCLYDEYKNPLVFRFYGKEKKWKSIVSKNDCPKKLYLESDSLPISMSFEKESTSQFSSWTDTVSYEIHNFMSGNQKNSKKVSCGNITDIPKKIPELTRLAINIVHIAVPVILVIMGSIDLFKGITAQKEDEIKKGQQLFVKRLILAALIFFVVVIVKLLISVVANSSGDNISSCIDCFISNDCD